MRKTDLNNNDSLVTDGRLTIIYLLLEPRFIHTNAVYNHHCLGKQLVEIQKYLTTIVYLKLIVFIHIS